MWSSSDKCPSWCFGLLWSSSSCCSSLSSWGMIVVGDHSISRIKRPSCSTYLISWTSWLALIHAGSKHCCFGLDYTTIRSWIRCAQYIHDLPITDHEMQANTCSSQKLAFSKEGSILNFWTVPLLQSRTKLEHNYATRNCNLVELSIPLSTEFPEEFLCSSVLFSKSGDPKISI